jgi:hypothetical protein
MGASKMTPQLPPGFVLDSAPALPPGFVLDSAQPKPTTKSDTSRDIAGGILRGAGSIGATLLSPVDWAARKLNDGKPVNIGGYDIAGQDRRAGMDAALQTAGVNTDSLGFGAGKIGAEVAGTLGVGGGLANVLGRAPVIASKAAPALEAIRTAGMSTGLPAAATRAGAAGNLALRSAGGGVTGAASATLVNPDDAQTGGLIGAAAPGAFKVAGYVGSKVGQAIPAGVKAALGMTTGAGSESIGQAFRAGKAGNADFMANVRGEVPVTDVLDRAKQGLQAMSAAKAAEYRSGMLPIKGDQTVLNLGGIDQALSDAVSVTTFKGQVKNEAAAGAVAKMRAAVDEWKALDPNQFHTPEGLDALKQKLGGVLESIPFEEKTARLAAGKVYNAAKSSIEQQAPTYAKVMKDYSEASQLISEIERTLSLKPNASVDTAMRKLQSLMRNNVQTNYSGRTSLAKELEQKGGVDLMPSLAGQAMNSLTPRSLSGQMGGTAAALMSMQNPLMLAALPFQSPRVVGTAAYGLGRAVGGVSSGANALQQALSKNPQLAALMSNPNALSDLSQLGYRAAPALVAGR